MMRPRQVATKAWIIKASDHRLLLLIRKDELDVQIVDQIGTTADQVTKAVTAAVLDGITGKRAQKRMEPGDVRVSVAVEDEG